MKLQGFDHVAVAVKDLSRSVRWYQEVLGLERKFEREWGDNPAYLVVGSSGIALFQVSSPESNGKASSIRILHLAFRTNLKNFKRALVELDALGIPYRFEDHNGVSDSIYFGDPDGHQIELTVYRGMMHAPTSEDEE